VVSHAVEPEHSPAPHSCAGSFPSATGVQVPAVAAALHASQVPLQAPSQHTPSAQKPEAQSAPEAQARDSSLFGVHVPDRQLLPLPHSAPEAQPLPHRPAPSHVYAPQPFSTSVPAGRGEQPPSSPGRLQASHAPPHAPLQHTPSAQKPEAQSEAATQEPPLPFAPLHLTPAVQLPAVTQAPLTHSPEAHSAPVAQPLPLGSVPTQAPPLQAAAVLHSAPLAQVKLHALAPPQALAPHSLPGSIPGATGAHAPFLPATLHAMQVPVQPALQHTPSAQKPEAHWAASTQASPLARSARHWPPLQ